MTLFEVLKLYQQLLSEPDGGRQKADFWLDSIGVNYNLKSMISSSFHDNGEAIDLSK